MKKINTHGLKMVGLKKASGDTRDYDRDFYTRSNYIQISYDRDNGEILTNLHSSLGYNSWSEYHDPAVITICYTSRHMTMQEIADRIAETVEDARRYAEEQASASAC